MSSLGEGSYGRLGHGSSDSESVPKLISGLQGKLVHVYMCVGQDVTLSCVCLIGVRVVQVVAGPRVLSAYDDGFALALTDQGEVYSWGKSSKGRLGHTTTDNVRAPRIIDPLSGKDIKQVKIHYVVQILPLYLHV